MTKPKRIEFITDGGCKSCDIALNELLPLAKERSIPVHVLPLRKDSSFIPETCIIREKDGKEVEDCIEGWDKDYEKDIKKLLD